MIAYMLSLVKREARMSPVVVNQSAEKSSWLMKTPGKKRSEKQSRP